MKYGHREVQDLFLSLGRQKGYITKKSFSSKTPTDGVWLYNHPINGVDHVPIAAIEVVVSESPKTLRGSISILEEVSPLIAIIFIHEEEIKRRLLSKGRSLTEATQDINRQVALVNELIGKSKQRFELWTESSMSYWKRVYAQSS